MIDVGRLSGQVSLVRGVVRDGRKIVSLLEVDFIDSHMNARGLVSVRYAMSTAPSGELNLPLHGSKRTVRASEASQ
jgi:hypothetical protein